MSGRKPCTSAPVPAVSRRSSATSRAPISGPGTITAGSSRGRSRSARAKQARSSKPSLPPPAVASRYPSPRSSGPSVGMRLAEVADAVDGDTEVVPAEAAQRVRRRLRAVDQDRVEVAFDRLAQRRAPLAAHALGAVVDVAQAEDEAAPRVARERVQGGGELPVQTQRHLVDHDHVGVERFGRGIGDARAQPIEVGRLDRERGRARDAVRVAGAAGQLHRVDARGEGEEGRDRRPAEDQRAGAALEIAEPRRRSTAPAAGARARRSRSSERGTGGARSRAPVVAAGARRAGRRA